jgi:hypothetical protein
LCHLSAHPLMTIISHKCGAGGRLSCLLSVKLPTGRAAGERTLTLPMTFAMTKRLTCDDVQRRIVVTFDSMRCPSFSQRGSSSAFRFNKKSLRFKAVWLEFHRRERLPWLAICSSMQSVYPGSSHRVRAAMTPPAEKGSEENPALLITVDARVYGQSHKIHLS